VKKEPKDSFNACQDFFTLVVHSHVLCVGMDLLKMDKLSDMPDCDTLRAGIKNKTTTEKEKVLLDIAEWIISTVVNLSTSSQVPCDESTDHVNEYACEVVSLGLLFLNYRDAVQEGDGERIMLCWKYFLLLFKATNRRNYAIEAFHTLANRKVLPPRLAHQLVWSRCINTHTNGKPGHNIPCDLYLEHVNRVLKECIHHLHANKTDSAISRVSQSMGSVDNIMRHFDQQHFIHRADFHSACSSANDRDMIIKEIRDKAQVFKHIPGRFHRAFPKFICNPLKKVQKKELVTWLQGCARNINCTINIPKSMKQKKQ